MSKYTEAIKIIYKVDDYISNYFGGYPYTDEEQEMLDSLELAIEALEIADRLEQAITDEQTADCIIVDVECVNSKHDKEVWLNGYNQALVDIRGDNTGNN